jgi:hypothetical protein
MGRALLKIRSQTALSHYAQDVRRVLPRAVGVGSGSCLPADRCSSGRPEFVSPGRHSAKTNDRRASWPRASHRQGGISDWRQTKADPIPQLEPTGERLRCGRAGRKHKGLRKPASLIPVLADFALAVLTFPPRAHSPSLLRVRSPYL